LLTWFDVEPETRHGPAMPVVGGGLVASVHCWVLRGRPFPCVLGGGGVLWAVTAGHRGFLVWWWWSAGVVVKCRVDASIFFLDL
jgi:hypothetical protein